MPSFHADMTVLDIVASHKATEEVFRSRDAQAGECVLCRALFDTLGQMAQRYGLDLDALLADLETAAQAADKTPSTALLRKRPKLT